MSDNEVRRTYHDKRNPKSEIRNPKRHGASRKQSGSAQKLQGELDELTSDLKRVQADFINYQRRAEDEKAQIMEMAKQDVASQLLPLLDNLERALGHVPKELINNAWAQGVNQIAKQAESVLNDLGIKRIEAKGRAFNPEFHEAVGMEEGDGDHEIVVEELRSGYKLGNKVIRPSMVKVGKSNKKGAS